MPFIGEISALATAVLWSISSLIFSAAVARIGSVQVNFMRMLFAVIFLGITLLVFQLPLAISFHQFVLLIVSGCVGLTFGDTFLFKAFQYIGARITMLLMSLAPAISAVLAYFLLNETITSFALIGMIVTLSGIAMVVLDRKSDAEKNSYTLRGILFGVLAAFGQAGGFVLAKIAFQESAMNTFFASFIRLSAAVIVLFPIMLFAKKIRNPITMFAQDRKALVLISLGAVVGPFLGITLSLIAVANTDVGIAATLTATVPIMMLPLVVFIQKEKLTWKTIAGAVISVAGVALLFLHK